MNLTRNSNGHDYLRCSSARQKQCDNIMSFPYHTLEPLLLVFDDIIEIAVKLMPKTNAERLIDRRILQLKRAIFRAKERLVADPTASQQPVDPKVVKQRGRIVRLENQLLDAEAEAYSTSLATLNGPLNRFKPSKTRALSSNATERHLGRGELAAVLRELLDGIVLHEYRGLTVHSKVDSFGRRMICALSTAGLEGIQVSGPGDKTGFIGASVFRGVMRSVWRTRQGEDGGTDKPLWGRIDVEGLLRRVHVGERPNGDWKAMVAEDEKVDELVKIGEQALKTEPSPSPAYRRNPRLMSQWARQR